MLAFSILTLGKYDALVIKISNEKWREVGILFHSQPIRIAGLVIRPDVLQGSDPDMDPVFLRSDPDPVSLCWSDPDPGHLQPDPTTLK